MKVIARQCPQCGDVIFSRANHDFRYCSCQCTAVDGGFSSYGGRILFKDTFPQAIEIEVHATRKELYDDWNHGVDKYGLLKAEDKNYKC